MASPPAVDDREWNSLQQTISDLQKRLTQCERENKQLREGFVNIVATVKNLSACPRQESEGGEDGRRRREKRQESNKEDRKKERMGTMLPEEQDGEEKRTLSREDDLYKETVHRIQAGEQAKSAELPGIPEHIERISIEELRKRRMSDEEDMKGEEKRVKTKREEREDKQRKRRRTASCDRRQSRSRSRTPTNSDRIYDAFAPYVPVTDQIALDLIKEETAIGNATITVRKIPVELTLNELRFVRQFTIFGRVLTVRWFGEDSCQMTFDSQSAACCAIATLNGAMIGKTPLYCGWNWEKGVRDVHLTSGRVSQLDLPPRFPNSGNVKVKKRREDVVMAQDAAFRGLIEGVDKDKYDKDELATPEVFNKLRKAIYPMELPTIEKLEKECDELFKEKRECDKCSVPLDHVTQFLYHLFAEDHQKGLTVLCKDVNFWYHVILDAKYTL